MKNAIKGSKLIQLVVAALCCHWQSKGITRQQAESGLKLVTAANPYPARAATRGLHLQYHVDLGEVKLASLAVASFERTKVIAAVKQSNHGARH